MIRLLAYIVCLCLLAACGSSPPAPVEDRYGRNSAPAGSTYMVQKGDTLYSIAFRYGLDYRRLAAANRIAAPYTIYPGQRLQLREVALAAAPPATTPSRPAPAAPPAKTTPTPGPVTKPSSAPATTVTAPASNKPLMPVKGWRWPSSGKVIRGYSATVHKGIDIDGKRGDPVVAVADGRVVYAGSGIVGLGELLIIKHDEVYLSAYGHNDRLLVAEGATVTAGQKIAEKGSSGTDAVRLHFEIRKSGRPIDPRTLLPAR